MKIYYKKCMGVRVFELWFGKRLLIRLGGHNGLFSRNNKRV